MKKNIKLIQDDAKALKKSYERRNKINQRYDKMDNSDWTLPTELAGQDGIRKSVAPDPAAALRTGVIVLSAEEPVPSVTPVGPSSDDRATANKLERGLMWELKGAAKRSQTKLVPDIIRSSVKYAEVAVYVDYLPWRVKDWPEDRKNFVLRNGQFALIPHNPSTVFPRYSPLGLEAVLAVKSMSASSVIDYYGDEANEFALFANEREKDFVVSIWDWTDFNQRLVWVVLSDNEDGKEFILIDEERDMSFIPWAIRMSGTGLEDKPENQRKAFLEIVEKSNLWEDMNIMGTLVNSEVLSYAAAPRGIIEGPNGEQVAIDYGQMNKPIVLKPGQKYTPVPPPEIDRGLTEILDRTKAKLEASTSVQVLQNLNFPAGTAFASINAVLKTAIASLHPYKVLSEMVLADIFETMLLWIDHTNGKIVSYGTGRDEAGEQFEITKQDFSTNALYIDVRLNASAPTDFMERINAGILLIQMGMPKARVFETLNVSDPEQAMIERVLEDFEQNEVDIAIQQRQQEAQQEAMMQQQMMQQMMQGPPPGEQGQPNPQNMLQGPPPRPGFENVAGSGFDTNAGGISPANAQPGIGREQIAGVDANGEPLVEV